MRIYTPDGATGRPVPNRAASPAVIAGLRIGVLDNAKPHARLLMTRMAERIAARTGASVTLVTDKGTGHNAATACSAPVLERFTKEVDLVITGSAD